jgi:DNA-binding SARP family transcriptional activator
MIHLHTLGDALITVGEKEIRPSSPMVFAALLYLGVERGRRVPRAALQELLFPESDERSGSHSVRQLLYKLRQLGAPIIADDSSVSLQGDIDDAMDDRSIEIAPNDSLRAGFLPAYGPRISDAFEAWLDNARDRHVSRVAKVLISRMNKALEAADHGKALDTANALLHHDPLNEEATLIRAKCLALTGQKQRAIDLLATYSAEVDTQLRLPADSLRRRILATQNDSSNKIRFVGRAYELQRLIAQQKRTAKGLRSNSLIWGDPGIGKTRLVQELASLATLDGSTVLWAHCQEHTANQPLGVVTNLVSPLLKCRGALGVSPDSMNWLKRLEARIDGDASSDMNGINEAAHRLMSAIVDLVGSVAIENTLVLVIEDAQWIDDASRDFFISTVLTDARLHLVITCRDERFAHLKPFTSEGGFAQKLAPLTSADASTLLLGSLNSEGAVDGALITDCVNLAAGNPLFLKTLALHLAVARDVPRAQASIPDLMLQRLQLLKPTPLLLLRLIAVFGNFGTVERIRQCLDLSELDLVLSLQDLADRGFVVSHEHTVKGSHQILIDTVVEHTPLALRQALYEKAALQLEAEATINRTASLMWTCADYWWRCGNKRRAASVLRGCASLAVELGQPTYAIPALERTLEISDAADLPEVLEHTISIADLATDDAAVLRNVKAYRSIVITSGDGVLDSVDLAEIRARRRLGIDVWDDRDRLVKCALSTKMPVRYRRRAARTYLASAEESFGTEHVRLHVEALEHLWNDADGALDSVELRMLFHLTMGDMAVACQAARRLEERINEYPMLTQPTVLNGIARALFVSGATKSAMRVSEKGHALATKVSLPTDVAMASARLADNYLTLGDLRRGHYWVDRSEEVASSNPFCLAYHLSNKTILAIGLHNLDAAAESLGTLKTLDEARKPHAVRSIIGLEFLWQNAAAGFEGFEMDFDRFILMDDVAGHCSEHLWFATGLFFALCGAGRSQDAEERFGSYILSRRRERYDPWPAIAASGISEQQLVTLQRTVHAWQSKQSTSSLPLSLSSVRLGVTAFGHTFGKGFLLDCTGVPPRDPVEINRNSKGVSSAASRDTSVAT